MSPELYRCLQRRCLCCVAAVILVSAEEVSVREICFAAVILVFEEEVPV